MLSDFLVLLLLSLLLLINWAYRKNNKSTKTITYCINVQMIYQIQIQEIYLDWICNEGLGGQNTISYLMTWMRMQIQICHTAAKLQPFLDFHV